MPKSALMQDPCSSALAGIRKGQNDFSEALADGSFEALTEALKGNKAEAAFRAAHTLKGICLNLGFDRLFERASLVTERLRGGNLEGAKEGFPELKKEYDRTADAVHAFLIH